MQEYRVYFSKSFSDTRLLLKFAKRKDVIINNATETDINKINQDNYPFSYIIVDTAKQLFLIQKNTEISTNGETIIHSVEKVFSSFLIEKSISLRLSPITKSGSFWETVENNMGKISSLEFEFLSPNFLGQSYKINELMSVLKSNTNVDSLKMIMKNENGHLTILDKYPFFKDALQYITNGGGKITSEEKPVEQNISSSILKIAILLILSLLVPFTINLDGNQILTYEFVLTTNIALFSLALAITAIFFTVLDRYQQALEKQNYRINSLIDESVKEMGDNTQALLFITFSTFIFSLFQSILEKTEKININATIIIFSLLLTFLIIYDITKATVTLIRGLSILRNS